MRGVASDALNLTTITCGEDGEIIFWPFKDKKILNSIVANYKFKIKLENEAAINKIVLHRERYQKLKQILN